MTNEGLTNKYLRGLLAREIVGMRQVRDRLNGGSYPFGQREHLLQVQAVRSAYYRIQTHLQRHGGFVVEGDPEPLATYTRGFAGH
jgi:hypothetical protein